MSAKDAFAIKEGVKLGVVRLGGNPKVSPPPTMNSQFQYYPHPIIAKKGGSGTLVGVDALKGGSSIPPIPKPPPSHHHQLPPKPPPIPVPEKSEPLLVVVPPQTPHASIHDIKLVSPIRSSHGLGMDEEIQPKQPQQSKGYIMIVSTTSLFLFLLNTWAMDTPSLNAEVGSKGVGATIHASMGFLNAMISPLLGMCIGYSMANSQEPMTRSMGVCGVVSISLFCCLFLVHKDEVEGNNYMFQQGMQLCGCILASMYCTWRLSLKFFTNTPKSIERRRRELAFVGCMFLLQALFAFLAVFIQDPIIVLWVWSIIAWGCTLP